ncbi:MAG: hypothetical protein WD492_11845 [Alkalispirochaeta sp.]
MRTTVNLDEDIIEVARSMSLARGISLGAALSILARRGIRRSAGHWTRIDAVIALPDVNTLVAAAWPNHIHHHIARR